MSDEKPFVETYDTLIDYLLGPPPHGPYPKLNARELVDVMPIDAPDIAKDVAIQYFTARMRKYGY